MALSKLKKIDLREEWSHEATDFTNWLAKDENLQLLSEEIGIDISLVQTEASVGFPLPRQLLLKFNSLSGS